MDAITVSKLILQAQAGQETLSRRALQKVLCLPSDDLIEGLRIALDTPCPHDPLNALPAHLKALKPPKATKYAYDQLYASPFHAVPLKWRAMYEVSCLRQALSCLRRHQGSKGPEGNIDLRDEVEPDQVLEEAIEHCDMAIIMTGAPRWRAALDVLLEATKESENHIDAIIGSMLATDDEGPPAKRRRTQCSRDEEHRATLPSYLHSVPLSFPSTSLPQPKLMNTVSRVSPPSLSAFTQQMLQTDPKPVIITSAISHWPALTRWRNPRYWLHRTHAGRRRVPIELGKSYVDKGWGQAIVPFAHFLREQLLGWKDGIATGIEIDEANPESPRADEPPTPSTAQPTVPKAYLAQHDLLTQIPALRADISIPDYCYCRRAATPPPPPASPSASDAPSDDAPPMLNIWLGPAGTVSPAHTDPHDNLYAQVVGRKYVRLYPPDEAPNLYPMGKAFHVAPHARDAGAADRAPQDVGADHAQPPSDADPPREYSMANTSSLDVGLEVRLDSDHDGDGRAAARAAQRARHPGLGEARFIECVLREGELLFIPRGWWHYVWALDVSASVSFWW